MTETTLTHAFSVNYFSSNLGRLRSTGFRRRTTLTIVCRYLSLG